jgi:hypothetical protein
MACRVEIKMPISFVLARGRDCHGRAVEVLTSPGLQPKRAARATLADCATRFRGRWPGDMQQINGIEFARASTSDRHSRAVGEQACCKIQGGLTDPRAHRELAG